MVGEGRFPPNSEGPALRGAAAGDAALTRVERRRQATRRRLVGATRDLILDRGINGYTVADLAELADVGVGTVYNHFGDWREEPLAELITIVMAEWSDAADAALAGEANAATAATRLVLRFNHPPTNAWSTPRLLDILTHTDQWPGLEPVDMFQRIVEAGIADGSVRPKAEPRLVAAALLGLSLQVSSLALAEQAPGDEAVVSMVLHILAVTEIDVDPVIDLT
jgi:AcrR family transcriptional regulator